MTPLFPLNLVLCPGEVLSLHIFEDRYKEMIGQCLADNTPFGILLVENHQLSTIGCLARITEVVNRFADGTFDIRVEGTSRFELLSVDRKLAWLRGTITPFEDLSTEFNRDLQATVNRLHRDLLRLAGSEEGHRQPPPPAGSFILSHSSGLSLRDKQKLVGMRDENARLEFLEHHLRNVVAQIRYFEEVKSLIRANGDPRHFPPVDLDRLGGVA
ncbi:MAG: LON peptidase substrate-binding domain-containing protein [Bacteroidetes bacterium]|nr:LON peptidase substrate-binding domain-containing protein [Bacteroidota bacterium]